MKRYLFTTLIWEEGGMYVSKCMEIELSSCGDTPKEALENLRQTMKTWLRNADILGVLSDFLPSIISSEKFTSVIEVETA